MPDTNPTGSVLAALPLLLLAQPAMAAEGPARQALIDADYQQGRTAFQQRCSACHTLAEDSANLFGPNLWEMMGRKAGVLEDFDEFSDAMRESGITWSPATLMAFISDPMGFIPGNTMMIPEPVPERDRVPMISFIMLETGAADWPRPESAMVQDAGVAPGAPVSERFPSFWNHLMSNTTRYRLVTEEQEFIFEAYFNTDGSVDTNLERARGFWHIDESDMFCYAIYELPIRPAQFVECFPVGAMAIPRFNPELWRSRPAEGMELWGGITVGRP
ncbi:MAG: c-type cytochrome [Chromatiales bacterium]|nr:c-type cytochrome [Chromatiales bacterium]